MIYFFKQKEILYSFPYFTDEKYIKEKYVKNHQLVSSLLFFNKNYKKELVFQKEIFNKNNIIIRLYKYNDIYLVEKNHDYSSNEYFIGIYFINVLRYTIPTFTYTFFKLKKKLWLEYNEGETLYNYLKNLKYKKINENIIQEEGINYLSIFFQILCSLEVAQEEGLFTHYDLHLENIMVNKNTSEKELLFPISYKEYYFKPSKYIISILDFEYSCFRSKKQIFNSIKPFLFHYGYFSIFFSGIDILRYFFSFFYNFYYQQDNLLIGKIFSFHNFILEKFYKISVNKINYKSLDYHSNYFFNYTFSKKIYKTPYELLIFLEKNSQEIFSIFSIKSLPFLIRDKESFPSCPNFIKPEKKMSLEDIININPTLFTIYKNKSDLLIQHRQLVNFRKSFEFFYFSKEIPSIYLKSCLKIYRYSHSIEQILLLKTLFPSTDYNYFELNIYRIPYVL